MYKKRDLYRLIKNSEYGVLINSGKKSQFLRVRSKLINLQRKILPTQQGYITNLFFRNRGSRPLKVYAGVVVDFLIPHYFPNEILENSWTQSGFSGYRKGVTPTKKKKLFLTRDQNPFSFREDYGYLKNALVSEWYTQLIESNESLVVGAISASDQFTQVYLRQEKQGIRVRVTCQLDGLRLDPGKSFKSEKIVFLMGRKQETLDKFADLVRKENRVGNLPKPIKGLCCAYYYQGNYVDERYILDQLQTIDKFPQKSGLELIQIDGLPNPWGDWLSTLDKLFPSGLDYIVKEINKRGLMAGFWIAPFVASPSSKLFWEHPDWFLKDDDGNYFEARFTSPFDFLPPLSFRALDPTHPEFQNHLAKVIEKLVGYGFRYIKTDFTYPVCFTTNYHTPMTRARALRTGFEVIKKAAGKDVLIQTCITQISPLIGLTDYCRVGLDILTPLVKGIPLVNKLVNEYMLRENLRNCEARNFWHKKIWINDPDCVVFRSGMGISKALIEKHKYFSHQNNTSLWTGDNLAELTKKENQDLFVFFNHQGDSLKKVI